MWVFLSFSSWFSVTCLSRGPFKNSDHLDWDDQLCFFLQETLDSRRTIDSSLSTILPHAKRPAWETHGKISSNQVWEPFTNSSDVLENDLAEGFTSDASGFHLHLKMIETRPQKAPDHHRCRRQTQRLAHLLPSSELTECRVGFAICFNLPINQPTNQPTNLWVNHPIPTNPTLANK